MLEFAEDAKVPLECAVGAAFEEDVVRALDGQVFELWFTDTVVDVRQHRGPESLAVSRGQSVLQRLVDVGVDLREA